MNRRNDLRRKRTSRVLFGFLFAGLLFCPSPVRATVFDWDNFFGNSNFNDAGNWLPGGGPPGTGDTAIFDGQLQGSGIGTTAVNVADGTAINDLQIFNSGGFPATVVDLTIGDGTTSSRFDLDNIFGDSLVLGNSTGDTATLNLLGGRLDTFDATIRGDTTFNVVNPGSLWDTTDVVVSGGCLAGNCDLPSIGLGQQAQIATHGNLAIGDNSGRGLVVVDGGGGLGTPAQWSIDGSLDIAQVDMPPFFGAGLFLQNGGRMTVGSDVNVQPTPSSGFIVVKSGGNLDAMGSLSVMFGGFVSLVDSTSSIITGDIDIETISGLNWSGGTLHITDGRLRIDDSVFADLEIDSLTVDSGMTLKVTRVTGGTDSLTIGNIGTGVMTVQNGGIVESYNGYIGEATSADGTVNVTGSPSRWTVTEDLVVGFEDSTVGRLNVTAGGQVTANSIYLGERDTADGTVTVDNGTLTSTAVLAVGGSIADNETGAAAGGTGQLTVQNGGIVDVEKTLIVFGGGAVNLTGTGISQLTADTIRLEPGATFSDASTSSVIANQLVGFGNNANFAGQLLIGHSGGSGVGSHTVGPGQTLTAPLRLEVGSDAVGSLSINGGTVISGFSIISDLEGSDGSRVDIDGSGAFWFAECLNVGRDTIFPPLAGSLTITNDAQVIVTDELHVSSLSTVILDSGIISASVVFVDGELRGNGAIIVNGGGSLRAFNNRGLVSPGLSVGVITINGSAVTGDTYIQEPIGFQDPNGGILLIEIGGTSPFQHDRLNIVDGSAALDGVLDVTLIDPLGGGNIFVPKAGDSFEILTADGGLGGTTFATLSVGLAPLTGSLFWDIVYGSTFVRLDVLTPYTADFDLDGDVDGDDLAQWEGDFGSAGSDADGDGDSDGRDFLAWQRQFGSGINPLAASQAVPEPASLVLLAIGCVGIAARRRR